KEPLVKPVSPFLGVPRSFGDREAVAIGNDEDCVAVAHVPFGTLIGLSGWCFPQRGIFVQETGRVREILGPAALWAPAAPWQATLNRDIKRGTVDAGLSAADDLHGPTLRSPRARTVRACSQRLLLPLPQAARG